jgi:replication initiation and membrane attachment protein
LQQNHDKYDNSGKTKNAPPGSRTPDWYNPDYKNETTTENQKVLERIKQESLDRMKN